MLYPPNPSKILVYLSETAGANIVAMLAEHGFQSLSVSTVPEAFDALRSDEFLFAITTRPDIDLLRNIRAVPVINLEVFFHAGISSDGSPVSSKRFDRKAFLERVEFLARPAAAARPGVGTGRTKASPVIEKCTDRWWFIAASALRIPHNRKDTMDVPFWSVSSFCRRFFRTIPFCRHPGMVARRTDIAADRKAATIERVFPRR